MCDISKATRQRQKENDSATPRKTLLPKKKSAVGGIILLDICIIIMYALVHYSKY